MTPNTDFVLVRGPRTDENGDSCEIFVRKHDVYRHQDMNHNRTHEIS